MLQLAMIVDHSHLRRGCSGDDYRVSAPTCSDLSHTYMPVHPGHSQSRLAPSVSNIVTSCLSIHLHQSVSHSSH